MKKNCFQSLSFQNHPWYLLTEGLFAHEIFYLERTSLLPAPSPFVILSYQAHPQSTSPARLPQMCLGFLCCPFHLLSKHLQSKYVKNECKYPFSIYGGFIKVCFPLDQGFST